MARRGGILPSSRWLAMTPVAALAALAIFGPLPDILAHARHGALHTAGGSEVDRGWTPRMQHVVTEVTRRWPVSCGGQADGTHTGHIPGSDHYTGNAADCAPGRYGVRATGPAKRTGDAVAAWAVQHRGDLHISYVIWYGHINTGDGWGPYCDQLDPTCSGITYEHYDHVHISVEH